MERILLAADYTNLSQLDIFIPHEEPILRFNGESTLAFSSAMSSSVHDHRSALVQACERRFFLSLSLHAIHARSSSKEDRWIESFSDRHVEDYSEKDRTSNQIEINAELDGLFEVWVE